MKRLFSILVVLVLLGGISTSCVKGKKSCKNSHKRIKKMRKSGQLNM